MEQLSELRRQYTLGHLTYQQKQELRMKIVDKIHLGTKLLDLDLVAREANGQGVDTKNNSAVHVYDRVSFMYWVFHIRVDFFLGLTKFLKHFRVRIFCDKNFSRQKIVA